VWVLRVLLVALINIFVTPFLAIVVANGIAGRTFSFTLASSWAAGLNAVLALSGLILWALVIVTFGLFGPIDLQITRLRASTSNAS
jgi:hypothetical protein